MDVVESPRVDEDANKHASSDGPRNREDMSAAEATSQPAEVPVRPGIPEQNPAAQAVADAGSGEDTDDEELEENDEDDEELEEGSSGGDDDEPVNRMQSDVARAIAAGGHEIDDLTMAALAAGLDELGGQEDREKGSSPRKVDGEGRVGVGIDHLTGVVEEETAGRLLEIAQEIERVCGGVDDLDEDDDDDDVVGVSEDVVSDEEDGWGKGGKRGPKTFNEVEEKPEDEDGALEVDVREDDEVVVCGRIITVLQEEGTVVVQSVGEQNPLKDDSILCLRDKTVVGKVREVFGPVTQPCYVVFHGKPEDAGLDVGAEVGYIKRLSCFLTPEALATTRGSDASNIHDEEVAAEEQEYSDDEAEAAARAARKRGNRRGGGAGRGGGGAAATHGGEYTARGRRSGGGAGGGGRGGGRGRGSGRSMSTIGYPPPPSGPPPAQPQPPQPYHHTQSSYPPYGYMPQHRSGHGYGGPPTATGGYGMAMPPPPPAPPGYVMLPVSVAAALNVLPPQPDLMPQQQWQPPPPHGQPPPQHYGNYQQYNPPQHYQQPYQQPHQPPAGYQPPPHAISQPQQGNQEPQQHQQRPDGQAQSDEVPTWPPQRPRYSAYGPS